MNPIDDQLDRLFRAGGARALEFLPPYGLETRVLAAWREAGSFNFWSSPILLRGMVASFVIMLLSFWPILSGTTNPATDYLKLADATVQADQTP